VETSRVGSGRLSRRVILIAASAAAFAVFGLFYWYWSQGPDPAHAARATKTAVPVSVATAARADVPIYLTGLGTVQALFTVAIHAQVDGKLQEVFFKEGNASNAATCWPRSIRACTRRRSIRPRPIRHKTRPL
jgi:multidrug efflux pump subunit AcrA (membrane-fusion protein)